MYVKYSAQSKRPLGHDTRGKTRANRLRRTDNFLLLYEPSILNQPRSVFVDLGYGEIPVTTIESANRFQNINEEILTIGVEIDKDRVAYAQNFESDLINFRHGGFNLPLQENENCYFIRAFNVLRQYEESDVDKAYEVLCSYLEEDGLLMEGTSGPLGRYWTANILRKKNNELQLECIVLSTNFKQEITPKDFQTILPKKYINCMIPSHPIYYFFADWQRFYQECACYQSWGHKQVFIHSVKKLAQEGYSVILRKRYISRGYVVINVNNKNRKKIL